MAVRSKKRRVVADAPTAARYDELKWTLIEREREILTEVQGKIREVRIALPRLRALPFAACCKNCEQDREMVQRRERIQARRGSSSVGLDLPGQ